MIHFIEQKRRHFYNVNIDNLDFYCYFKSKRNLKLNLNCKNYIVYLESITMYNIESFLSKKNLDFIKYAVQKKTSCAQYDGIASGNLTKCIPMI